MEWLKQIAPTVATALGGPLAGLATKVISEHLGVAQPDVKDAMARLDKDQIEKLRLAEIELRKLEKSLGLDFEKLANEDRASARAMQIATRSFIPAFLAVAITFGFFGILTALMLKSIPASNELLVMLGSLGTAWTGIIGFYFGSSAGSQDKNLLLAKSEPGKNV
jgi:hypothetical protein